MKIAFEEQKQYGTLWLGIYSPAVNNLPMSLVELWMCFSCAYNKLQLFLKLGAGPKGKKEAQNT